MKDPVIIALQQEGKPKAQFNELLQLFMKHPEHNYGQARFLNRAGFSKVNLENLKYDIQKLYGIRAVDLATPVKKKEEALSPEQKLLAINFEELTDEEQLQKAIEMDDYSHLKEMLPPPLQSFTQGTPGNKEMKEWLAKNEITHKLTTKKDMLKLIEQTHFEAITIAQKHAVVHLKNAQETLKEVIKEEEGRAETKELQKIFTEAPDDVKGGMKLRERYPFLNAEDCPDKLKVLTSDMITAFNKYMGARNEIQQMVADGREAELFEMAKVAVENFELNKEIQDELDHYQEHGEILGNHIIFADEMLQQKVATYKTADLKSKRGNIRSYVTKENKKLAKAKTEESKAIIQSKIDGHLAHIALIEARLEGDGKK